MQIQRKQKQAITLLEIMIVIFLIGIIGGVVGYNVKASLDKGKAFKTEYAIQQIQEILLFELANGTTREAINENPKTYIQRSDLCKNPDALLRDGWGGEFHIHVDLQQEVKVSSTNLSAYQRRHATPNQ
ncbi:MAG: general secretion pathway protein GspG [Chlamydiae bacterium]|nr:general secretion pathway protein GspG [Chlamydiota bacterium]